MHALPFFILGITKWPLLTLIIFSIFIFLLLLLLYCQLVLYYDFEILQTAINTKKKLYCKTNCGLPPKLSGPIEALELGTQLIKVPNSTQPRETAKISEFRVVVFILVLRKRRRNLEIFHIFPSILPC